MEIVLLERNINKYQILKNTFRHEKEIEVVNDELAHFLDTNNIECIVSPANSFGLMDGGYDLAISEYFGNSLQKKVQKYIIDNYYGEQPVGTSFIIKIDKTNKYLIHTPTMRIPEPIVDKTIIYQCMRTTLMEAYKNNIKSIVIPMFGGSAGEVDPLTISKLMLLAYKQIKNPDKKISWDHILYFEPRKM